MADGAVALVTGGNRGIGRALATILAALAEYEKEILTERQLAGIAAKARGVRFGRRPGEGAGKPIKVTPEQRATVRHHKAEGWKVAAIARATGLSRPTVYAVLKAQPCADDR